MPAGTAQNASMPFGILHKSGTEGVVPRSPTGERREEAVRRLEDAKRRDRRAAWNSPPTASKDMHGLRGQAVWLLWARTIDCCELLGTSCLPGILMPCKMK